MARGRKMRLPRLRGARLSRTGQFHLWSGVSFLLLLGMLTTVIDLVHVPAAETRRANAQSQRAVIDPATGAVSLGTREATKTGFDVAPAPPAVEPSAPEAAEPAEKPPEAAPAEPADAPKPSDHPNPASTGLPAGSPTLRTEPLPEQVKAPSVNSNSLVNAPAPEITEKVGDLRLPKRGLKDASPASIYSAPFQRKPEQILVSFVVLDVGLDTQSLGMLLDLPKEITIAYSPYARNASQYSESFRRSGHELWTMLPAASDRFPADDPGPMGMVGRMPKEELVRRMHEAMGAVVGSVGFILPSNENITSEKETTATILNEISARGLLLVTTKATRSIDQVTSDEKLAELIRRADLILDPSADESQIKSKLAALLANAHTKGDYIVVMSARPQTVQILRDWLKDTTMAPPLVLAPLSALYQARVAPVVEKKDDAKKHGGEEAPEAKDEHSKEDAPKTEEKKPAEPKKKEGH